MNKFSELIIFTEAIFLPLRVCTLTLSTIGFVLRSVQTHISIQIHIEMCVCTLINANPTVDALKGIFNFTLSSPFLFISVSNCDMPNTLYG
jgi:hypothetical protein